MQRLINNSNLHEFLQLLRFEEGGEVFEAFKNIKVQIFSKVYIYNVTNPEDVASGKSLPKFVEIGPYVYE